MPTHSAFTTYPKGKYNVPGFKLHKCYPSKKYGETFAIIIGQFQFSLLELRLNLKVLILLLQSNPAILAAISPETAWNIKGQSAWKLAEVNFDQLWISFYRSVGLGLELMLGFLNCHKCIMNNENTVKIESVSWILEM